MKNAFAAAIFIALLAILGILAFVYFQIAPTQSLVQTVPAPAPPAPHSPTPAPNQPVNTVAPQFTPTTVAPADPQPVPADAPPPAAPAAPAADAPDWKMVYEEHFDTAASVKKLLLVDGGELAWSEKYQALFLKNDGGGGQIYAAVHASLPGDLRVRLKVLRPKNARDINIGMLFSIDGSLKGEEGYFAEIKQGSAHIKRCNRYITGADAPTPATEDRWVRVEMTKVGGKITLSMEGKEVLTWTDDHPFTSAPHDLFSLYVWNERMLVDDLVIDRNRNDPVKPNAFDPADPSNAVHGERGPADPNPDQF